MTPAPLRANPLLSVDGLTVHFPGRRRTVSAVRGLSFAIQPGETMALVGESGSGKSVTALSIMRLIEREGGVITGGTIRLHHDAEAAVDLAQLPEPDLRRLRGNVMSMIFQEPMTSLNPVLPIGEQLAEVLMLHESRSRTLALAEAKQMLDRVRIPDAAGRLARYPHELSGGMRQRVMIAMALLCRPHLLIADEPTTALDVTIQAQILSLIDELRREIGMAVLFITHDLGVVAEIADRVVVMRHGEAVESATVNSLFEAPTKAYTRALMAAVPRLGDGGGPETGSPGTEPVLSVRGLVKRFPVRRGLFRTLVGHVHAVEQVSFDLHPRETLALVGESGSGKSTAARTLMRLVEPSAGRITLAGRDVTTLSRAKLQPLRRDIQMIFQDPYASLNPRLAVVDSVTEPLAIHEPGLSKAVRRERAAQLLARVGLEEAHLDCYPHQFSGGQRQRLCIARALSLNPRVIIADEPVSALDVSVQAQVIELMRSLQRDLGLAYLFISHDMGVVERMSHRVAVMHLGQIVEIGPTSAVLERPAHPYTRRLLDSVPVADPARRRVRGPLDTSDIPSPVGRLGTIIETPPLVECGRGHFVQSPSNRQLSTKS